MKRFLKLALFSLIIISLVPLFRFSTSFFKPLAFAASAPLCGICPAGTERAGMVPIYGYTTACNLMQEGNPLATFCNSNCTASVPTLPACTGITISPIPSMTINAGSAYVFNTGSFTDQFVGPYSAMVDYGDGSAVQTLTLSGYSFSLNHIYQNVGTFTLTVTISDVSGMSASVNTQVNVTIPTVGPITVDNSTVVVNTAVTAFATFTDPVVLSGHTAVWNWGDGVTSVGTVTEANGSGSVSGNHSYITAGVYTVTLTVSNGSGSGSATYQYVSVYDPSGSFLTGSGTFPSSLGDLKFGVHAKYVNNSFLPKGEIELDLKKGSFEFETSTYQWLVISGNVAYIQGTGKLNERGSYNILFTAVDGTQTGTPDLIRVQITDPLTNTVTFDSEPGSPIYARPTTQIIRGSIKIHH